MFVFFDNLLTASSSSSSSSSTTFSFFSYSKLQTDGGQLSATFDSQLSDHTSSTEESSECAAAAGSTS